MTWRVICISLLIGGVHCIWHAANRVRISPPFPSYGNEARLASQEGLTLETVSYEDLLLLPNVSDGIAKKIIGSKHLIAKKSCTLSESEKHKALEVVRGIGPKTALNLSRFLVINCTARIS